MTQTSITRSWVASANGHIDFPLQNLPLGVFSIDGGAPRSGVAIGDHIFDLEAALDAGLFEGTAKVAAEATRGASRPDPRQSLARGPAPVVPCSG